MPERSRKKLPIDINQIAANIVGEVTADPDEGTNPAAVALGRLGSKKGGLARPKKLTQEERREIASHAAQERWRKAKE